MSRGDRLEVEHRIVGSTVTYLHHGVDLGDGTVCARAATRLSQSLWGGSGGANEPGGVCRGPRRSRAERAAGSVCSRRDRRSGAGSRGPRRLRPRDRQLRAFCDLVRDRQSDEPAGRHRDGAGRRGRVAGRGGDLRAGRRGHGRAGGHSHGAGHDRSRRPQDDAASGDRRRGGGARCRVDRSSARGL